MSTTSTPDRLHDPDNPLAWVLQAACFPDDGPAVPLEELFVDAGHSISEETYQTCVQCPVRMACLKYAYDEGIDFGYFGGVSPSVRKRCSYDELVKRVEDDEMGRGGRRRRRRR